MRRLNLLRSCVNVLFDRFLDVIFLMTSKQQQQLHKQADIWILLRFFEEVVKTLWLGLIQSSDTDVFCTLDLCTLRKWILSVAKLCHTNSVIHTVFLLPLSEYIQKYATEEALKEQEEGGGDSSSESSMSDFSEDEAQDMELWRGTSCPLHLTTDYHFLKSRNSELYSYLNKTIFYSNTRIFNATQGFALWYCRILTLRNSWPPATSASSLPWQSLFRSEGSSSFTSMICRGFSRGFHTASLSLNWAVPHLTFSLNFSVSEASFSLWLQENKSQFLSGLDFRKMWIFHFCFFCFFPMLLPWGVAITIITWEKLKTSGHKAAVSSSCNDWCGCRQPLWQDFILCKLAETSHTHYQTADASNMTTSQCVLLVCLFACMNVIQRESWCIDNLCFTDPWCSAEVGETVHSPDPSHLPHTYPPPPPLRFRKVFSFVVSRGMTQK